MNDGQFFLNFILIYNLESTTQSHLQLPPVPPPSALFQVQISLCQNVGASRPCCRVSSLRLAHLFGPFLPRHRVMWTPLFIGKMSQSVWLSRLSLQSSNDSGKNMSIQTEIKQMWQGTNNSCIWADGMKLLCTILITSPHGYHVWCKYLTNWALPISFSMLKWVLGTGWCNCHPLKLLPIHSKAWPSGPSSFLATY